MDKASCCYTPLQNFASKCSRKVTSRTGTRRGGKDDQEGKAYFTEDIWQIGLFSLRKWKMRRNWFSLSTHEENKHRGEKHYWV